MNLVYEINWNLLRKTLLTKSLFQLSLSAHEDVTWEHPETTEQNWQSLNSIYIISKFQI